eukprot:34738-Eustigmatos_ZCMA.PRE.1
MNSGVPSTLSGAVLPVMYVDRPRSPVVRAKPSTIACMTSVSMKMTDCERATSHLCVDRRWSR